MVDSGQIDVAAASADRASGQLWVKCGQIYNTLIQARQKFRGFDPLYLVLIGDPQHQNDVAKWLNSVEPPHGDLNVYLRRSEALHKTLLEYEEFRVMAPYRCLRKAILSIAARVASLKPARDYQRE